MLPTWAITWNATAATTASRIQSAFEALGVVGVGNVAIAVMLAAGALGTLFGGRLSDLHGFRKVVDYMGYVDPASLAPAPVA